MKTPLRLVISLTAGTTAFFASVLGIEYLTWMYSAPADPLTDPLLNVIRFGVAGSLGLATALMVYPRVEKSRA